MRGYNSRKSPSLLPASMRPTTITSVEALQTALQDRCYIADRSLAVAIYLALKLRKPLFLEGEAGVGKTEVAKVLAAVLDRPLIRLQCYEGLDVNTAVYEWNYARQILYIRLLEAGGPSQANLHLADLFGPEFLLKRPILQALDGSGGQAPVLLIDEIDRADEEFEAFLLEVLSDFQVTIPEIGTLRAAEPPIVVITSNRTREVHDALKRRCLYHWLDYPTFARECAIVHARVPQAPAHLTEAVVRFVQRLRQEDLYKKPGVAETLDWMEALLALDQEALSEEVVLETLGVLLKYQDDIAYVAAGRLKALLS